MPASGSLREAVCTLTRLPNCAMVLLKGWKGLAIVAATMAASFSGVEFLGPLLCFLWSRRPYAPSFCEAAIHRYTVQILRGIALAISSGLYYTPHSNNSTPLHLGNVGIHRRTLTATEN